MMSTNVCGMRRESSYLYERSRGPVLMFFTTKISKSITIKNLRVIIRANGVVIIQLCTHAAMRTVPIERSFRHSSLFILLLLYGYSIDFSFALKINDTGEKKPPKKRTSTPYECEYCMLPAARSKMKNSTGIGTYPVRICKCRLLVVSGATNYRTAGHGSSIKVAEGITASY